MSDQEGNDLELDQERAEIDARRQGWRPLEEFKGPEKAWVDAETFLARGTEIRSFTKAENEKLRRELAEAKASLIEQGKTIEEIREYHAKMEERAIAAAVSRLKAERRAAMGEGNMELAAQLAEEIDELKDAPSAVPKKKDASPPPQKTAEQSPEITAWNKENASWYNDDADNEDLVAYANGMATKLGARNDLSIQDRLDMLTERVKKAFPDRFGTKKPRVGLTSGAGEGGGREGSRKSATSVSALPADARAAGARYVKQRLYKDMEEYAQEYFNQPGARQ